MLSFDLDIVRALAVITCVGIAYFYYITKDNRWFLLKFILLFLLPVIGVIFLAKTVYRLFRQRYALR